MSMCDTIEEYLRHAMVDEGFAYAHLAGNGAISALEAKLSRFYGTQNVLCVDSATGGLMYLLMAARLQHQEILTTSLSYGGTVAGALALDCKIHFADVDGHLNISPDSVADILARNPGIKAVLAVDFAGNPHDMRAINKICREHGIWHFVDAAQSMGACQPQHHSTPLCDAMVLSFGSGKTLFAGGKGGAIVTGNGRLYDRLVMTCQHPHRQERDVGIGMSHEFSLNGSIHPLAAIMANETFDDSIAALRRRQQVMDDALSILATFPSVASVLSQAGSTYYHCPFIVTDEKAFCNEFSRSALNDAFRYSKASFRPLQQWLKATEYSRNVRTDTCHTLEKLLRQLYLLHVK